MADTESYKPIEQEPHCSHVDYTQQDSKHHHTSSSKQSSSIQNINDVALHVAALAVKKKESETQHETSFVGQHLRWWKYVVLFGTFFEFLLVFGFFKGIGVFIVEWQEHYQISTVEASTITIGTAFVLPFSTPIGGALCQRYGCRPVTVSGALIASVAMMGASFSPNVPVLIFLLCVCGLGLSMTFAPCPSILGFYFGRHLGFASGIMMSGVGAGILLIPPIMQALCNNYGWQGALLIMSAIFANAAVCGNLFRLTSAERFNIAKLRSIPSQALPQGSHLEKSAFLNPDSATQDLGLSNVNASSVIPKDQSCSVTDKIMQLFRFLHVRLLWTHWSLTCFYISTVFVAFGYYSSLVYIIPRAVNDIGVPKQDASYILSTIGIASMFGRATHGILLDRDIISVFRLAPILLGISGISSLLNPSANSYILQHLLAITFGIGSGAYNGMMPMLIRTIVDSSVMASAFGLYVMITAFGNIIGAYSLGALYDATGSYHTSFYVAGGSTFTGVFLCILLAFLKRHESSKSCQEDTCEEVEEGLAVSQKTSKV